MVLCFLVSLRWNWQVIIFTAIISTSDLYRIISPWKYTRPVNFSDGPLSCKTDIRMMSFWHDKFIFFNHLQEVYVPNTCYTSRLIYHYGSEMDPIKNLFFLPGGWGIIKSPTETGHPSFRIAQHTISLQYSNLIVFHETKLMFQFIKFDFMEKWQSNVAEYVIANGNNFELTTGYYTNIKKSNKLTNCIWSTYKSSSNKIEHLKKGSRFYLD